MTDPSPARVAADRGRTERREADEAAAMCACGHTRSSHNPRVLFCIGCTGPECDTATWWPPISAQPVETVPPVPAPTPDRQTGTQGREPVDVYELREQGVRVLGDEQCCELGCNGGACESCPCCCAGWCVFGHSGEIPDRDLAAGSDYRIWLAEAVEHNPVAKALAERDRLVGVDYDEEPSS